MGKKKLETCKSKEHIYAEGKVGSGGKILGIEVLKGVSKKNKLLGQDSSGLRKSNFSGAREKSECLQGWGKSTPGMGGRRGKSHKLGQGLKPGIKIYRNWYVCSASLIVWARFLGTWEFCTGLVFHIISFELKNRSLSMKEAVTEQWAQKKIWERLIRHLWGGQHPVERGDENHRSSCGLSWKMVATIGGGQNSRWMMPRQGTTEMNQMPLLIEHFGEGTLRKWTPVSFSWIPTDHSHPSGQEAFRHIHSQDNHQGRKITHLLITMGRVF